MSSGDYDLDRYAEPMAGLDQLARQQVWPYGYWLWWRLSAAQRRGLDRGELIGLLGMGMCAQSMLSLLWLCEVVEGGAQLDDLTRATLDSITAMNSNSMLLARLIAATGLFPYRVPIGVRLAARIGARLPAGPIHRRLRPLLVQAAAPTAEDPAERSSVIRLRLLTGVRHVGATREDLIGAARTPAPMVDSLRRWALSAATAASQAVVGHPAVYRTAGLASALGLSPR